MARGPRAGSLVSGVSARHCRGRLRYVYRRRRCNHQPGRGTPPREKLAIRAALTLTALLAPVPTMPRGLRPCALLCALRVAAGAPAAVPTLADHPVAGDAFLSLTTGSGTSWSADSPKHPLAPPAAKCTFKTGFDWNEGVDCPVAPASTQQLCCDLCHARPDCMASTFYQGKCFFKSAADVSKGMKPGKAGVVACVKGPSAPPAPPAPPPSKDDVLSIDATVPGASPSQPFPSYRAQVTSSRAQVTW